MTESLLTGSGIPEETPGEERTNILREKTFTPELRELVSRISHNEESPSPDEVIDRSADSSAGGPNELLRDLHQLFYAVKFSGDGEASLPSLDHLKSLIEKRDGPDRAGMHDLLSSLVPGYDGFVVLSLDEEAGAYIPVVKNHFNDPLNALSVGLHDVLFAALQKGETIVSSGDSETLGANEVLAEYLADSPDKAVTFITFDLLTSELSLESHKSGSETGERTTAPLVLAISSDGDFAREKGILPLVQKECLYDIMMLLAGVELPGGAGHGSTTSLEKIIKDLEILRRQAVAGDAGITLLIRGTPGKDHYAAFSFLMVKLRRIIGKSSAVVRVWSEMVLCQVSPSEVPVIEILIKDFNNAFDDAFTLKRVDDRNMPGIGFLLEDILT